MAIAVIAVVVIAAFAVGYFSFGKQKASAEAPAANPVAKAEKPKAETAPSVQKAEDASDAQRLEMKKRKREEFEKRREERLAKEEERKEAEHKAWVKKLRKEQFPDELRYRNHVKLPEHLQERIDADRERRTEEKLKKDHPELAARREAEKKIREERRKRREERRQRRKETDKAPEAAK